MTHHGTHAAVLMRPPGAKADVQIDSDLAELIGLLWENGLRTTECCQDDVEKSPGSAFVDFGRMADAVKFIKRVDAYADDHVIVGLDRFALKMHLLIGPGVRVLIPTWAIRPATEAWM